MTDAATVTIQTPEPTPPADTGIQTGIAIERASNAQDDAEEALEVAEVADDKANTAIEIAVRADDKAYDAQEKTEWLEQQVSTLSETVSRLQATLEAAPLTPSEVSDLISEEVITEIAEEISTPQFTQDGTSSTQTEVIERSEEESPALLAPAAVRRVRLV